MRLAGWAGWLAGWLAGSARVHARARALAGWLAGWLAGRLAGPALPASARFDARALGRPLLVMSNATMRMGCARTLMVHTLIVM